MPRAVRRLPFVLSYLAHDTRVYAPTSPSAVEAVYGYVESLAPDRKYLLMALKHTEQDDGVFYVRLGFLASDYKPANFHVTDWPFSEFRGDNARDVFLSALDGECKRFDAFREQDPGFSITVTYDSE